MAHKPASAFQQTAWIGKLGAAKETDIDVRCEGIDIGECRITYTRGRMAIMQQLSNIVSAVAHNLKPVLRDCPQITGMLIYPTLNRRILSNRTGETHEPIHMRNDSSSSVETITIPS
jgi:hypothetical protein